MLAVFVALLAAFAAAYFTGAICGHIEPTTKESIQASGGAAVLVVVSVVNIAQAASS